MKALVVARKTLLELLREPLLLGLVVLIPLAFLVVNALGYGAPLLPTHPVEVVSSDSGGAALVEALRAVRYADGRPAFAVTLAADRPAAEKALQERTITALVVVAPGAAGEPGAAALRATLYGDAIYMNFIRASVLLNRVIQHEADRAAGRPEVVRIEERPLVAAGAQTAFDQYTPGMIVFGILLIVPQTAMLLGQEVRRHTLRRLRISCLRAGDLFAGITLAQMVVALAQVLVIFAGALALGFHNHGSLGLAVVLGLALSFSAVGQGLLVACFISNDSEAVNVGSAVTMLQVFFSGSFFALPPLTVFTIAGHAIGWFDLIPATHGMLALQQVLTYGAGWGEIAFRLGATLLLSILYFALGVAVFQRRQMRGS